MKLLIVLLLCCTPAAADMLSTVHRVSLDFQEVTDGC